MEEATIIIRIFSSMVTVHAVCIINLNSLYVLVYVLVCKYHFSGSVHNVYSLVKTESSISEVYNVKLAALVVLALTPVL
jgi:hypothetical protein